MQLRNYGDLGKTIVPKGWKPNSRATCPVCDTPLGMANRVAERQHVRPWRWVPIGWRCVFCGMMVIDRTVTP